MNAIRDYLIECGFSREQVSETLRHWDIKPLMVGDHQVGEFMMQNNEVHFALHKSYRLKSGRAHLMRAVLKHLVDEKGFVVTKLYHGDKNKRLIEFMGFTKINATPEYETFWLDEELLNARHQDRRSQISAAN